MTILLKHRTYNWLLLLLLMAAGCKREDTIPSPGPEPIPGPLPQEVKIDFTSATIAFQQVDSALLVVRDEANYIKKEVKLLTRSSVLYAGVADMPAGNYKAELLVYTKKEADQTARQYAIERSFTLPLQTEWKMQGPTGSFTDNWFKRAVLFAPGNEVTAIVAMDPRDAYYSVSMKEDQWQKSMLQRSATSGNVLVAIKRHDNNNLPGVIGFANYAAFIPYTELMAGQSWTKASISLYLKHNSGRELFLDYEYLP